MPAESAKLELPLSATKLTIACTSSDGQVQIAGSLSDRRGELAYASLAARFRSMPKSSGWNLRV